MISGGCYRVAKTVTGKAKKLYSWTGAKTACEKLGGWLASFPDREQYDAVITYTANSWFAGKQFWVGGLKEGESFMWQAGPLDGDEIDEELWADEQPNGASNQLCVQANYGSGSADDKGLDSIMCKTQRYGLCEGSSVFADDDCC